MTFGIAKIERRIASLEANRGASLRFGTVTEVNAEAGSARVQLPDGNNMVSYPLRVLQPRVLNDQRQMLPDLGEPVAALFSGQGLEQGVILGAHYSTKNPPPGQPAKIDYTRYADGTELFYDREAHKLTAKVKGDVEVEATGRVSVRAEKDVLTESSRTITLKAPCINLAGKLTVTDCDGRAGSGDLFGDYRVISGSLKVPDGDIIAGVTRLRDHTHKDVEPGPGISGAPTNGGQNGDSDLTEDDERERVFERVTDSKDTLVLCMPEMVAAEAAYAKEQGNEPDHQGWLYLHEGIIKWLHGKGTINGTDSILKDKYDNGYQDPLWVEWNWLMQYERFKESVERMKNTDYLFSIAARSNLTKLLRKERAFTGEGKAFNHIFPKTEWKTWRPHAFQGFPVNPWPWEMLDEKVWESTRWIKPDGFQAAIANTTIYALASGKTEPLLHGKWRVIVEKVAFFIHDGFDFNESFDPNKTDFMNKFNNWLGTWVCDVANTKTWRGFNMFGDALHNEDFRHFREATGYGCDFRTVCAPELVFAEVFSYDVMSAE